MPKEEQNLIYDCECCGGTFLKVKEGEYKCDHCGYVKHIETTNSSEIVSLLNNANILRNKFDFDEAAEVFEQVVKKDPNNPEGYWGLFLCEYGIAHQEDPKTHKFLPTCNRASVVSVFEDENYQKAIELATGFQKEDLKQSGEQIEEIIKRVVKLSKNESPYDIFICYKKTQAVINGEEAYTKDSVHAREIYEILTKQGYKVFFAEKTLQNVAGNEYEAIIFNALNTSKVMLVVCSKLEYANAPWVKNEWRRFVKQMEFDESKKLLPIMCGDMSAGKLPDLLKRYQALEINVNFQQNLLASVKNCIGLNRSNVTRVEIGQVKSAKKSNTIKSAVETRKITANKEAVFKTSDQVQLKNAFMNLNAKTLNLKDAWEEFSDLKDNPKLEPIADYVLEFIKFRVKLLSQNNIKKQKLTEVYKLGFNSDVFLEKFNRCVENADKDTTETVFNELKNMFELRENQGGSWQTVAEDKALLYTAIMSWNYGDKKVLMEKTVKHIKAHPETAEPLFDAFVKFYDPNDVDGYIQILEEIADTYTDKGCFDGAISVYNKILEVDEGNKKIRWKRFRAGLKAKTNEEIKFVVPFIEDKQIEEFKEVLSYIAEKEREEYITIMTTACCKALSFLSVEEKLSSNEYLRYVNLTTVMPSSSAKKLLSKKKEKTLVNWDYKTIGVIFDKFAGLYSEKDNLVLSQKLLNFADSFKYKHHFEDAIRYFNMAIQEGDNNIKHKAYWGIMQCKMKCVDDEDVIYHKTPVKNYAEFQSAINAAGEVGEDAVEKYLIIKNKQAKAGKDPRKKKKSSPKYQTGSVDFKKAIKGDSKLKFKMFFRKFLKALPALILVGGIIAFAVAYFTCQTFIATPIKTYEDLVAMREAEGGRWYLAEDIDMAGHENFQIDFFRGQFYGNGKTIKNYTITEMGNKNNIGFFQYVEGAKISNINFENVNINLGDGSSNSCNNVGTVAGSITSSNIYNIKVEGTIYNEYGYNVGGVVGYAKDTNIRGCTAKVKVTGREYVGGIVGAAYDITDGTIFDGGRPYYLEGCVTEEGSVITGTYGVDGYVQVGGVVGRTDYNLRNLKNYGDVVNNSSKARCTGGVVGDYINDTEDGATKCIEGLENFGKVTTLGEGEMTGGVFGFICETDITVKDIKNHGLVSGYGQVGGIAGRADSTKFDNIHSTETSKVVGNGIERDYKHADLGGLIGYHSFGQLNNATNKGEVVSNYEGAIHVGGLVGVAHYSENTFENLENYGKITINATAHKVGGLYGRISNLDNGETLTLKNCRNEVEVVSSGDYVGGLIGQIQGYKNYKGEWYSGISFENCKQLKGVAGGDYVGMLVGDMNIGSFKQTNSVVNGNAVGLGENVATQEKPYYGSWKNNQ